MKTTNFDDWLSNNAPFGHEEVYQFVQLIRSGGSDGRYVVSIEENKTSITECGTHEMLVLLGEDEISAFERAVMRDAGISAGDDLESWYGFQRNMANPKA